MKIFIIKILKILEFLKSIPKALLIFFRMIHWEEVYQGKKNAIIKSTAEMGRNHVPITWVYFWGWKMTKSK